MGKTRGTIVCYTAGILFGIGWWFLIGATFPRLAGDPVVSPQWFHYVPGVVGTLALIMCNMVSWGDLNGSIFSEGATAKARAWLFLWLTVEFGATIAGCWIAFANPDWFGEKSTGNFPGIALIINVALILVACLLYRFARGGNDGDGF